MTKGKDWKGNSNSVWKTLGASNHTEKEREPNEFYATSPIAIDKLAAAYDIPLCVWECACGQGHLAKRLEEQGHIVLASDLVNRGYGIGSEDFFLQDEFPIAPTCLPIHIDANTHRPKPIEELVCILTNPPYKYATEFVEHAMEILPKGAPAIMLLKTTALEGKGRWERLYSKGYLKAVYQFSERLLCAKNGDFEGMKAGGGSAVAYSWFIFANDGKNDPPKIYWI